MTVNLEERRRAEGVDRGGKNDTPATPASIRGLSTAEKTARFVEAAADMEMGYLDGVPAGPYKIKPVMVSLGYSANHNFDGTYYSWLPDRPTLNRMVALKVMLREAQRQPQGEDPAIQAAFAASMEELLTRLYLRPLEIGNRELFDLVTKLARLRAQSKKKEDEEAGKGRPVAIKRVTETILHLPPEEQDRARKALAAVIDRAKSEVA